MPRSAQDSVERSHKAAYSPAEAAVRLSISRAKLYVLITDGTLASVKLGGRRLIRHSAIEDLLDRLELELA